MTSINATLLNGKLQFSLINKDTNYVDLTTTSELEQKTIEKKNEMESNSYNFKLLVYWNKANGTIRLINYEESIENINKEIGYKYAIVSLITNKLDLRSKGYN